MHRVFATSSSPSSPDRVSAGDSPSPPAARQSAGDLIDLTMDSAEEDLEIETPPLNPVQHKVSKTAGENVKAERVPSVSPPPDLGPTVASKVIARRSSRVQVVIPHLKMSRNGTEAETPLPDLGDLSAILEIPWSKLEERRDRCRLLAKIIGSLADDFRLAMTDKVPKYGVAVMQKYVEDALEILCQSQDTFPGVDEKRSQFIMRTASFFISWVNCAQLHRGIRRHYIVKSIDELEDSFAEFFNQLCNRLEAYRNWARPQRKSKALGDVATSSQKPLDSSEGDLAESADTPHKKRKREVKESLAAKNTQASAKRRVAVQQEQREKLKKKLGNMGISNDDSAHQVVSFDDPVIYLDPHIGQVVKPHQLEGIQFMWRELIRDETQEGCLLAHTMGLGKTMQVVALLVTIAAAASSGDPKVRQQVPEAFHRPQTLIICPSSLIENWFEEIILWAPQDSGIGLPRKVTSASPPRERLQLMSEWDQEGGILIISYNMFHAWIFNKETPKRPAPLLEEDHEKVKKWLLEGPSIIIADEAHMMKNPATAASRAAMQFRSKSRIALTGSPLANNLVDYFTMVDWIAKGYLGEFVEFKANFVEPIEQGLYLDSSRHERRRSLVKLKVLQGILNPKINRADISVLAGSLPPKVEFVLTVPLTKVQTDAYNLYVNTILQGRGDIGNAKLWSWLAILSLCCNHPACFRDKLLNRASEARKIDQKLREVEELPGDEPIGQAGLPDSEKLVVEQEKLFASIPDMKAVGLSYRAQILDRIIEESVRVNDKVLVFSHSLLTLDYIEHVLTLRNRKYCRLDGNTPVQSRQMATKNFNTGVDQHVYLISTRAGGLGLNIPGANRVIIFDFAFNPVWEQQSVGRAYRLGQKKPVFVYRFISGGTFEEIVYNNVVFKTQLAFRVVDKKNPIRQASKSPGDYLFPVKQVSQEDISEFTGKDPDVLDKILLEQNDEERSIRKIALTETFRREDDERLTEEETKGVQEELDDERLKRTNPEEYIWRIFERQRRLMAEGPTPILAAQSHPALFPPPNRPVHAPPPFPSQQSLAISPSVPTHAHNVGPPALNPDTSVFKNRPAWSSPAAGSASFPPSWNELAAYSSDSPGASSAGAPRPDQRSPSQGGSPSTQAPRTGPHGPSPLQQPPGLPPQTLGGQIDGADGSRSQSPESDEDEHRDYWTSPSCKTQ
ncbi:P-loop containing nucleoside triphosphate hydrolase protein [Aspergillus taichungensis]|uniref:P-loop containing nucleoside triphosphate hydrolase protein n=1 Tax=Aspergillus taichungensis TaxID=482145 RepID=A0A2J5HXQ1_9EURO|nr:P-loop containing nucleoside triphosphate hydrolase protein [Aspergillus taichungensis]